MTESGLSNSIGAPRANHERVLGNQVLRTLTDLRNGRLVTDWPRFSLGQGFRPGAWSVLDTGHQSAGANPDLKKGTSGARQFRSAREETEKYPLKKGVRTSERLSSVRLALEAGRSCGRSCVSLLCLARR